MEFELTIRGNTEELPPFLELLRKTGGDVEETILVKTPEPDFPTEEPWSDDLQLELWESLSPTAKELMLHLGMECNRSETNSHDLFDDEWICNTNGYGHLLRASVTDGEEEDYCPEKVPCERPVLHRAEAVGDGVFPGYCGIEGHSLGARLANIKRNLANPKYSGLTSPIRKQRQFEWGSDSLDNPHYTYALQSNWPPFIAKRWEIQDAAIHNRILPRTI